MNLVQHLSQKASERGTAVLTAEQVKALDIVIPEGFVTNTYLFVNDAGKLCVAVKAVPKQNKPEPKSTIGEAFAG